MKKFSYSVLFTRAKQKQKSIDPLEAYRTFVASAIQSNSSDLQRTRAEVIQKNGTILRGGLTQFLSTPLKSDKDDIIKLIEDSIENSIRQLDAAPMLNTVEHSLWNIIDPQDVPLHRHSSGVVKRMLKQGRTMLKAAGSPSGKNAERVIVSRFLFDGFSTMLPLKKIIEQFADQHELDEINNVMNTGFDPFDVTIRPENQLLLVNLELNEPSIVETLMQDLRSAVSSAGASDLNCWIQTFRSTVGSTVQFSCSVDMSVVPVGAVINALSEVHPDIKAGLNNNSSLILLQPLV